MTTSHFLSFLSISKIEQLMIKYPISYRTYPRSSLCHFQSFFFLIMTISHFLSLFIIYSSFSIICVIFNRFLRHFVFFPFVSFLFCHCFLWWHFLLFCVFYSPYYVVLSISKFFMVLSVFVSFCVTSCHSCHLFP